MAPPPLTTSSPPSLNTPSPSWSSNPHAITSDSTRKRCRPLLC
jgi:hypothetical protein